MSDDHLKVIKLHYARGRRTLEVGFEDGMTSELSAEFLRVHSPSAEVRGHGPGQETLQSGKSRVSITAIEPVGHYAVQLLFDDGHDSGLFSWRYLRELGEQQASLWQTYLDKLSEAGQSRDPEVQVLHFQP